MGTFSVRKTKEQFIADAISVHGNKYDYSKVEYITNSTKVCIICPIHGEFWQSPSKHLSKRGCPKCKAAKQRTLIYGVATCNELGQSRTPEYGLWFNMIRRCYHTRPFERAYNECSVCDEWLDFSNFKQWFNNLGNGYVEGYHLDKDIITKGNTIYSPSTCCFVPIEINSLLTKRQKLRGKYPIGVSEFKQNYQIKYKASISKYGSQCHLGYFNTPNEAFNAYKIAKEQYIKELAEKYFQEGKITKRVYNALMKYEVEITD